MASAHNERVEEFESRQPSYGRTRLMRVFAKHLNRPITFAEAWADRSCGPIVTTGLSHSTVAAVVFDLETMTPRPNLRLDDPEILRTLKPHFESERT